MELCGVPENKVHAIPSGLDGYCFETLPESERDRVRKKFGINGDFILSVGTMEPRKNMPRIIEAFGAVRKKHPDMSLVIAGPPGSATPEMRETIGSLRIEKAVILTGYAERADIRVLYRESRMLAFPSLYEGFGFPVLEAMASGTPVLTSRSTALPEVAGDAALLVSPESTEEIAEGMLSILDDENLAKSLSENGMSRAKQFSWDTTAGSLKTLYESLVS
jgi:alpha-1,3-rhamnosyl/mannosyltransferase